jgi:tRNA threonylcarbamoyladenosine biosynthesis protein TsaE
MPAEFSHALPDAEATARLGEALAPGATAGRVLFLSGELGTGKTTLARGLLRALGYRGRVKSPSYSLVELYPLSRLNLYHFDFFRFKDRSEWVSSGFREYFNPESVCVVEWPERAAGLLAPPDLEVRLQYDGAARRALLRAYSAAGRDWASAASKRLPQA